MNDGPSGACNSIHFMWYSLTARVKCVLSVNTLEDNVQVRKFMGWIPKFHHHHIARTNIYVCIVPVNMNYLINRYLWRGKNTFAIAQHKHHRSIYEEADANKRRKRYARPLIDLHMKIYYYEGMEPWSPKKSTVSGKRESNFLGPLFCCICLVFFWVRYGHMFTGRSNMLHICIRAHSTQTGAVNRDNHGDLHDFSSPLIGIGNCRCARGSYYHTGTYSYE